MGERITVPDCRQRAPSDLDFDFLRVIIALEAGVRSHGLHQEALFLALGDITLQLITGCLLRFSNYFTYIRLAFLRSL